MNRLHTCGQWLLIVGVLFVPAVALAGAFLFTAGTDETWILLGVRGLVEHGRYAADSPFNSVKSTGGLYTVATSLLHILGGGRIEILRLFSAASLAALLYMLYKWAASLEVAGPRRWLVAASPLLVPGTVMFGSLAYGSVPAFLLLALGYLGWGVFEPGTWRRRLVVSLLIGTAAATRFECAFGLCAPLAVTLLTRGKRVQWIDSLFLLAAGGCVFLVQVWSLWAISVNLVSHPGAYAAGNLFADSLGYIVPRHLAYWTILQGSMPCLVAALSTIAWANVRRAVKKPCGVDALLAFGWIATLVWLLQAPIPHLRYLWPALAAFAAVGMLSLALLLPNAANHRWSVLGIGAVLLATGYLDAGRSLLHGESDVLSWEWSRETRFSLQYGPFRYRQYQRAIADRLRQIPPEEPVATIAFDTALSFLTRRVVVPVRAFYEERTISDPVIWRPQPAGTPVRPRWLLATPMLNRYPSSYMSHRLHGWIEANCRVADRQGPYVLYEVVGAMPETGDVFALDAWEPRLP